MKGANFPLYRPFFDTLRRTPFGTLPTPPPKGYTVLLAPFAQKTSKIGLSLRSMMVPVRRVPNGVGALRTLSSQRVGQHPQPALVQSTFPRVHAKQFLGSL